MHSLEAAGCHEPRIAGLALLGTTARPETDEMRTLREDAIELFAQGRAAEVIEGVCISFRPSGQSGTGRDLSGIRHGRAGAGQLLRQNRAVIARADARVHLRRLRCSTLVRRQIPRKSRAWCRALSSWQGPAFCFEPIDAFHLPQLPGLRVLNQDETFSLRIQWRVEALPA